MKKLISTLIIVVSILGSVYSQKNEANTKASLEAAFIPEATTIFAGDCIYFTDASTGGPSYWRWSFPGSDTQISEDQNPVDICYMLPGVYDVILEVQNANAIDSEIVLACITVEENTDSPIASFRANYTTIPVGSMVNFTNTSQNGPFTSTSWIFQGGNPNLSNSPNPTPVTYFNTGFYNVELTVQDGDGNVDTYLRRKYIRVVPNAFERPTARFASDRTFIAPGDAVNFTDLSSNYPYIWEWKFEGGTPATSNLQNPFGVIYAMPGSYDVELIVKNNRGSDTIKLENYIVVSATDPCFTNPGLNPIADFTASQRLIRSGTKVFFQDKSQNNPTIWRWEFEGGFPRNSSASNITRGVEYNLSGSYYVSLSVYNECGGSDLSKREKYIMVYPNAVPMICDTIKNVSYPGGTEGIYSPNLSGSWGKIGGHNGQKSIAYAEYFNQYSYTEVRELVMVISELKKKTSSSYVTFCIWDGSTEYPEILLGEKKIYLSELSQNFGALIAFDAPIEVNGPFFAGYKLNYSSGSNTSTNNDQFAVSIAGDRGNNGRNTLYVQELDGTWKSVKEKFGISTSSTIAPMSCIIDVETFDVDNNVEVFPNPATDIVYIQTGDLNYGKNIIIQLVDITGRILTSKELKAGEQSIEINVNAYPEGLYFINMMLGQHKVARKIMITR